MFSRSKKNQQAIEALGAQIIELRDELASHIAQLATERSMRIEVAERLSALEGRVSSMGGELSRQLHELSDEIEQLTNSSSQSETDAVLTALKTSQARLANEQARYEIAFRQDLAALAEQLRRKS